MSEAFKTLFVKTCHANGEERYWIIAGAMRVVDFQAAAAEQRRSPIKQCVFIRAEDLPGTAFELHTVTK